jgi:hypothetical protein
MTDQTEIKRHTATMNEEICASVDRLVKNSIFIWRGQLGDNTTKSFRISGDMVLVMDSQESCVITLFRCYFDFGTEMDKQIIAHEIARLDTLHEELKGIDEGISEYIEQKQLEISTYEQTIKAFEAQIASLRTQKNSAEEEIKAKRATRDFTTREIEKRAVRICNSIEYRKDLNAS